ncbi:MFS transporter [Dyella sp. M7H15-1]|uniref:MFS transporter n=1 Tax=Dyella sp. M7H15-1 TaxID=2501295 RepID=UPI001004E7E6|nr:MFS transporter [Dyella sp. M7H15-1]QAU24333.1 MFS transporter [Dyella sp. M7H15-1]
MVSVGSRDIPASRGDERERQRSPDKHNVNRFKSMFDQAVALAGPAPASAQSWLPPTPPQHDDDTSRAAVNARPKVPDAPPPVAAPLPSVGTQALALRASTGPLAGLIVQANWYDNRLHLRVKAPTEALRQRIAQHGDALTETLSEALGVSVAVEVEPTDA